MGMTLILTTSILNISIYQLIKNTDIISSRADLGGGVVMLQPPPKHLNSVWNLGLAHNPHSQKNMAMIAMHYLERIPGEDILKAFI